MNLAIDWDHFVEAVDDDNPALAYTILLKFVDYPKIMGKQDTPDDLVDDIRAIGKSIASMSETLGNKRRITFSDKKVADLTEKMKALDKAASEYCELP